jgi:Icc-related predicted phosphoesterase
MKLRILSDVHNEFGILNIKNVNCDAVILAGDTDIGFKGAEWGVETLGESPVLYITGNHEYYGRKIPKIDRILEEMSSRSRLIFFNNSEAVLNGVRFLGCTLWSDFNLFGKDKYRIAVYEALNRMTDYRRIRLGERDNYRKIRPEDTIVMHRNSVSFLEKHLKKHFNGPTVVITHHLPSPQSLDNQDLDDLIWAAYCTNLEWMIQEFQPELWVHGHRHRKSDYYIGKTRILCNPRGYAGTSEVLTFDPDLVVEI